MVFYTLGPMVQEWKSIADYLSKKQNWNVFGSRLSRKAYRPRVLQ